MRINPIAQNYYNNRTIQQQNSLRTSELSFQGPSPKSQPQQISKLGKIGYLALAIIATPLIIVGMLEDAITTCITGQKE